MDECIPEYTPAWCACVAQIKDLEEEVARSRVRQDQLIQEVHLKQEQVAVLQQDLASARAATLSRAQLAGRSELAELERLLHDELGKGLALEGRVAASQAQLHAAESRAGDAAVAAKRAHAELGRQLQAAHVKAEAAERQLKVRGWGLPERGWCAGRLAERGWCTGEGLGLCRGAA